MSKIVIEVTREFHDLMKIEAIKHGQSMKDFIVSSMIKTVNQDEIKKDFTSELSASMSENASILKALSNR